VSRVAVLVAVLALAVVGCETDEEEPEAPDPGAQEPAEEPDDPGDADEPAEPDAPDDDPAEVDDVAVDLATVASGLEVPWDVDFTDDGRAYVTERDSGVLSLVDDDGDREQVAAVDVDAQGEGGLLGVAVDPDDDDTVWVYYTTSADNRIARLEIGGDPEPVFTGIPRAGVHNGGRLAFGPDGMLWATTGDAGEPALSPDPDSLGGKILRLTPDGDVPDDNPTDGSPVYASGIRNSQGLAWNDDGDLYITEFGPDVDDAVLRVEPGSDQGWNGEVAQAGAGVRDFPDPVAVEQPPDASWSGAALLSDGAIPQWEGDLFVTALRGERLWRFPRDGAGEPEQLLVGEAGRLRHVAQAPDGSLWVLTSNRDGRGTPTDEDDRILRLGP
jgi:glucose/arabinose dehydrogenase